jgi:hypothetical protein
MVVMTLSPLVFEVTNAAVQIRRSMDRAVSHPSIIGCTRVALTFRATPIMCCYFGAVKDLLF